MSDWTAGYVAECGYTYGYYPELNPLATQLAFAHAGLRAPQFETACELGFGQGLSVNVHAAASSTRWYGNDFIPEQAAFAQQLAAISGAAAQLTDESFADFTQRSDLPDFDFIAMHGIWSWVSAENRAVIIDFLRRKLKPGGVLYMSYNALPGWSAFAPMRQLMTEHAGRAAAAGDGIIRRIDAAVDFAGALLATDPLYLRSNPAVLNHFRQVAGQARPYLAHEYFNRDWAPMYFAEVADLLAPAGLSFACSASYFEHIDALNMTAEQQAFLLCIEDARLRESSRDYMLNQRFRRDYWIKEAPVRREAGWSEALARQRVMLIVPREEVPSRIIGSRGGIDMDPAVYDPLLDVLATQQPCSLDELAERVLPQGLTQAQLVQALIILCGMQQIASVQDAALAAAARPRCAALNAWLIDQATRSEDIGHLLSPLTGGGIAVPRLHQVFLQALRQTSEAADLARHARQVLADEAGDWAVRAQIFIDRHLPVLRALQIVL
jgi:SAM-dependent methyltransferase